MVKLVCLASALHLLCYLYAAPEHVVDPTWLPHSRFHILQAMFWVAGADALAMGIAWYPLARRERWATVALGIHFLMVHASYFFAMAALPAGRPPELIAHVALGAVALLFAAGLVGASRRGRIQI